MSLCSIGSSNSSYNSELEFYKTEYEKTLKQDINPVIINKPNPYNFIIKGYYEQDNYCLIYASYPDCATFNYEGNKLLLFENIKFISITKLKFLEPHFLDDPNFITPIARFVPNKKGAILAGSIIKYFCGESKFDVDKFQNFVYTLNNPNN